MCGLIHRNGRSRNSGSGGGAEGVEIEGAVRVRSLPVAGGPGGIEKKIETERAGVAGGENAELQIAQPDDDAIGVEQRREQKVGFEIGHGRIRSNGNRPENSARPRDVDGGRKTGRDFPSTGGGRGFCLCGTGEVA